jgi:hypothetical protein
MVFLTITSTILEALDEVQHLDRNSSQDVPRSQKLTEGPSVADKQGEYAEVEDHISGSQTDHQGITDNQISQGERGPQHGSSEPSLSNPKLGNPISHGQIIDLWNDLRAHSSKPKTLDSLLRGARVYNSPPKPKAEAVRTILLHPFLEDPETRHTANSIHSRRLNTKL